MSKLASTEARALADAFDAVPACLAFFDLKGELAYANRAISDLWGPESQGEQLRRAVQGFAASLCVQLRTRDIPLYAGTAVIGVREFRTETCNYYLRGSYIASDLFGCGSAILISVEAGVPSPVSNQTLLHRFRLTAKEILVARLLAEGKSNVQIATELSISPHTARTHTEHVLQKLGAQSRAQVGSILRGI